MRSYTKRHNLTLYKDFKAESFTWAASVGILKPSINSIRSDKYYIIWKNPNKAPINPKLSINFKTLPTNFSRNSRLIKLNYYSFNLLPITKFKHSNVQFYKNTFKLSLLFKSLTYVYLNLYLYLLNFITYWSYSLTYTRNLPLKEKKLLKINYLTFSMKSI